MTWCENFVRSKDAQKQLARTSLNNSINFYADVYYGYNLSINIVATNDNLRFMRLPFYRMTEVTNTTNLFACSQPIK